MSTQPESKSTKFTPAPWRWEVKPRTKEVSLCGGRPLFDLTVMTLVRWGMNGAKPRFLRPLSNSTTMILDDVERFAVPIVGREHHEWIRTIDHPDAHLIAAAPELYEALKLAQNLVCALLCGGGYHCGECSDALAAIAKAEGRS